LRTVPLILAGLYAHRRVPDVVVRTSPPTGPAALDARGALLAVVGLGGAIYALTAAPAHGWLSAPVLVAGGLGVASLAALLPVEPPLRAPMLPLSLFPSRQLYTRNATPPLVY